MLPSIKFMLILMGIELVAMFLLAPVPMPVAFLMGFGFATIYLHYAPKLDEEFSAKKAKDEDR